MAAAHRRHPVSLTDDPIFDALEALEARNGRYYADLDADGQPIYKAKGKPIAPATVNRYGASLAAVFTWAIKKRLVPRGFENPCRHLERRPENNERVRFLSDDERERLFAACRASTWPRLYLLVLMAVTTGARRGELEGLRWADVDADKAAAYVDRTKNGDRKVLPLLPSDESARWFLRQYKRTLVESGALPMIGGRWMTDPTRADEALLEIGERKAREVA